MDVSVRLQSSVLLCHLTTATLKQTADIDTKKQKLENILWSAASSACQSPPQEVEKMLWPADFQSVS